MTQLFTYEEQHDYFQRAQQYFLDGEYTQAESILRLVITSALQQNDYKLFVSCAVWLNRVFINCGKYEQLYHQLLQVQPFLEKYASDEEIYFNRLQTAIFNNMYHVGDPIEEFRTLYEELLQTEYKMLAFITGSNLLYIHLEHEQLADGLALLTSLNPLVNELHFTNKMTLYIHSIYCFLLYFALEHYEIADEIIKEIETNDNIHIVDSFKNTFYLCKALNEAKNGDIELAKKNFHDTLMQFANANYIRIELKLWVRTLKQLALVEDVMYYQSFMIDLLEKQYTLDVKKFRKESIENMSKQVYEGRLYSDPLTTVYNRNYYENLLSKQLQLKHYTLVVLDIDRFKQVNDTYGHSVGDLAIQHIAKQMREWCPKHDIDLIRFGGDEFIIVIPYNIRTIQLSLKMLHEQLLHTPLVIEKEGLTLPLSISMGVAYSEDEYTTIAQLFEAADATLYEAKKTHGTILFQQI